MTVVQPTKQLDLREKITTYGVKSLSDTELLAVFISSGTSKKSCLQLAFDLMQRLGDLRAVLTASPQSFKEVSGLGAVPYAQLQAVTEICRRSDLIDLQRTSTIQNSRQTHAFLKKRLRDNKNETLAALFLDSQHRIIAYEELFSGTINSTTIYSRPIITRLLQHNAAALILAHNHPSGICHPSSQDIEVTERIAEALDLVDAKLLDHLVIGDNRVYSIMAEHSWSCR